MGIFSIALGRADGPVTTKVIVTDALRLPVLDARAELPYISARNMTIRKHTAERV